MPDKIIPNPASLSLLIRAVIIFKKKVSNFHTKEILSSLKKVLAATFLTIFFTYFVRQVAGGYMGGKTFWVMFFQTLLSGGLGFSFYLFTAYLFKSPEVKSLKNFALSQMGFLNGKKIDTRKN